MNEVANEVLLSSTQAFLGDLPWHRQFIIPWRGHKEKRVLTNLSMKLWSTGTCCNLGTSVSHSRPYCAIHKVSDSFPQRIRGRQGKTSDSALTHYTLTRVCTVCVLPAGLQWQMSMQSQTTWHYTIQTSGSILPVFCPSFMFRSGGVHALSALSRRSHSVKLQQQTIFHLWFWIVWF